MLSLVTHTVDLAVLIYAGAHLNRFDQVYLRREISVMDILSPFPRQSDLESTASIELRRCSLQCLNTFHSHQWVWIFSSSDLEPQGSLSLSTTVEAFADIWGPLWKEPDPQKSDAYTRYIVGNGSIFKWQSTPSAPSVSAEEVLCHWVSDDAQEQDHDQSLLSDRAQPNFNGREIMLIGAVSAGRETLIGDPGCLYSISDYRAYLQDSGRLRILKSAATYTYKSSETYQLQVRYSCANVAAARQYKRMDVQPLKKALVELWTMEPELRDPRLLEVYYSIEISLCTNNAQRAQLARILGLQSMREYLKNFNWTVAVWLHSGMIVSNLTTPRVFRARGKDVRSFGHHW